MNPVAPVHLLVIPRKPITQLSKIEDGDKPVGIFLFSPPLEVICFLKGISLIFKPFAYVEGPHSQNKSMNVISTLKQKIKDNSFQNTGKKEKGETA